MTTPEESAGGPVDGPPTGNPVAEHDVSAMYGELRRVAGALLAREKAQQTLQPTALVHEAYLRLFGRPECEFENKRHFFAAAAEAMRRVLIDRARAKARIKRGGDLNRVDEPHAEIPVESPSSDLLALDDALLGLEAANPRAREIVNLRYFSGLTAQETADVMGTSRSTVEREWRFIKAWMRDALGD